MINNAKMIQQTNDYDLFEQYHINRDVKRTNELEKSMLKYGWIDAYPMHVVVDPSGQMRIKAGHHRFKVAQKIGIPVKYVICDKDDISIHELETSTIQWGLADYMESYVRQGKKDYIDVKEYHKKTGIPIASVVSILAGECSESHNYANAFKRGSYKVSDKKYSIIIKDIVLFLKKEKIEFAPHRHFVNALSKIIRVDAFNSDVFKHKSVAHKYLFERQADVKAYMILIERIYNRQNKQTLPLAFLATEASKQRQKVWEKI